MGIDIENEINKIRWERWRRKQKTEREKTCFYCWDNWNNWSNWSDTCTDGAQGNHYCVSLAIDANYSQGILVDIDYLAHFCHVLTGPPGEGCGNTLSANVVTSVCAKWICEPPDCGWCSERQYHSCGYLCGSLSGTDRHNIPPEHQGYRMQAYAKAWCTCAAVSSYNVEVQCEVG